MTGLAPRRGGRCDEEAGAERAGVPPWFLWICLIPRYSKPFTVAEGRGGEEEGGLGCNPPSLLPAPALQSHLTHLQVATQALWAFVRMEAIARNRSTEQSATHLLAPSAGSQEPLPRSVELANKRIHKHKFSVCWAEAAAWAAAQRRFGYGWAGVR